MPRGGRRLPPRARDHRADREDRLERGPLAAGGRAGPERGERRRPADASGRRARARRAAERARGRHIPTERELELERELSELRERLETVGGSRRGAEVIVFGTAVTDSETYDRCAAPGHPTRRRARLGRPRPPDRRLAVSQLQPAARQGGRARGPRGARPAPPGRRARRLGLRRQGAGRRSRDPDVAIVGCAGAVGVRSIAWWQGAVTWAGLTHRYPEYGGGDFPAISLATRDASPPTPAPARWTRSTAS